MQTDVLTGGFENGPVQSAQGFRAALDALARPGTIQTLAGAQAPAPVSQAAATLMLVLCDAETPVHLAGACDTDDVRKWIAFHLSAPLVAPEEAAFAIGAWSDLVPLHRFPIGTPEYPDRSTTFIVEVPTLDQSGTRLTGPGIQTESFLNLPETEAFVANRHLFPQGYDFFLTCADRIAGLPRSTIVEGV